MKKIYILTGPVHSGKTSELLKFIKLLEDVEGILTPVINSKRYLYDIKSKDTFLLEDDSAKNLISIGKYKFSKDAFYWANEKILGILFNPEWLIIDEIGPLELKGEGFYYALMEILDSSDAYKETNLLLVVRDTLLDEVLKFFNIRKYEKFDLFDFNSSK